MERNLTAYAYLRSSCDSITESLESQREDIAAACERLGIKLIEEFTDEKISTIQPSPGLQRLQERIRIGGRVDFVLIRSVARLTRNVNELHQFHRELKKFGTELLIGPDFAQIKNRYLRLLMNEIMGVNRPGF